MSLRACRILAIVMATIIPIWQIINLIRGTFPHPFLVPDLVACLVLGTGAARPVDRSAAAWLLAGFAGTAGVFLSASSIAIVEGRYGPGPAATSLGLVPCLVAAGSLVRHRST